MGGIPSRPGGLGIFRDRNVWWIFLKQSNNHSRDRRLVHGNCPSRSNCSAKIFVSIMVDVVEGEIDR